MDIKSQFESIQKKDERLSDRVRLANLPKSFRRTSEVLCHSGDTYVWWPILVAIWVFGDIFWKQWAVTIALGIVLLGITLWPIKHLVNRRRPIGFWGRRTREHDPDSFPSGHAARSFLLAVLATGLGPAWLAVLFWLWAPLVSIARVSMGVHFLSDVVGGALLAIAVGLLWLYFHEGVLQALLHFSLTVLHLPLW